MVTPIVTVSVIRQLLMSVLGRVASLLRSGVSEPIATEGHPDDPSTPKGATGSEPPAENQISREDPDTAIPSRKRIPFKQTPEQNAGLNEIFGKKAAGANLLLDRISRGEMSMPSSR